MESRQQLERRVQGLEREVFELRADAARRPVREAKLRPGGADGNIIIASVDGAVDDTDPGGLFDDAAAIVGTAPADGTGSFINLYQQQYADNDVVILFQDKASGDWYTERGGSAGSIVVTFELTQDKSYGDVAKLAKPVDETGAIISAADAFYVVDQQNRFYGKTGYQGVAVKIDDDYTAGVPGYRIIAMEGPAHLMTGVLAESYSSGGTDFTPSTVEIWGRPFRGRRLPAEGAITVYDDLDVASAAQSGDKWLIAWDEVEERYNFIVPLEQPAATSALQWGEVTGGTVTAATGWLAADRGSGTVQFKSNADGTDDGSAVTIANPFFDTFDDGSAVCCDRSVTPPLLVSVGCTPAP